MANLYFSDVLDELIWKYLTGIAAFNLFMPKTLTPI